MKQNKLIVVALCLVMVAGTLCGCGGEILLTDSAVENIRAELGYVLAPAYMPPGFEFDPGMNNTKAYLSDSPTRTLASLTYSTDEKEDALHIITLSYPESFYPEGDPRMTEIFGLTKPEEALSMVSVNGRDAYLVLGNWDTGTLEEVASAVIPTDPRWDYDAAISVYFDIDVPAGESVTVALRASSYPGENWISREEVIRIAESVVIAD
jgi:hypothetical protein